MSVEAFWDEFSEAVEDDRRAAARRKEEEMRQRAAYRPRRHR